MSSELSSVLCVRFGPRSSRMFADRGQRMRKAAQVSAYPGSHVKPFGGFWSSQAGLPLRHLPFGMGGVRLPPLPAIHLPGRASTEIPQTRTEKLPAAAPLDYELNPGLQGAYPLYLTRENPAPGFVSLPPRSTPSQGKRVFRTGGKVMRPLTGSENLLAFGPYCVGLPMSFAAFTYPFRAHPHYYARPPGLGSPPQPSPGPFDNP